MKMNRSMNFCCLLARVTISRNCLKTKNRFLLTKKHLNLHRLTLSSSNRTKMDFGFEHKDQTASLDIACQELKERLGNKSKYVVCVEGNIGCGKTTLLNYFKGTDNCEVLSEPVDKWRNIKGFNALELMYKDPNRWGMTLQTYVQLTMLKAHTKAQECPVKLMERSIFSAKYCFVDNLFKSGRMAEIDHIILTEWFDWIIKTQDIKVDLFVYLRTDPEVLYSRIKERCRKEEMGIPLDYLKTLHQLHEDWLIQKKVYTPAEVLVMDANNTLQEMEKAYELHREKICAHPLS